MSSQLRLKFSLIAPDLFLRGSTSDDTEANDLFDESCLQPFVAVNVGMKSQLLSIFKQTNISVLLFLCFLSV